ncbi:MAG: ABC transporter ATP-binding protein, partial [Micrococcales bacterium]|nr:ABC transporter ATP-binding protein [Micrococcales bacterium]
MSTAVAVEHLSKRFARAEERRSSLKERLVRGRGARSPEFVALDDVSFDVPHGTTFGLVGHNGSGKSTLLKILAGVFRPSGGQVSVDGRVSALLELGAGFHGELTGRENVYLNGAILGMSKRQVDASIDQIIAFSGIEPFIDQPVKVYSSGMYVRLGFAIVVTLDPEILIVDEIIAVGDEEFQRKCFDHLFRLRGEGATIVLVTHSMGLAAQLCENAAWLDHGRLRTVGPAPSVIDDYLAEVNRLEAGRHEGDRPAQALAGVARAGSGEVTVAGVELLGADGRPAPIVLTGEPLTVRVRYTAHRDVDDVAFYLGFVHENGIGIAGCNTRMDSGPVDLPAGTGT